jgi:hypothetical protein
MGIEPMEPMKPGEIYQWKPEWHQTFQHVLIGSEDQEQSFIQTIWIDPLSLSSECVLPSINAQGGYGIRAENFKYRTNHMVFIRPINLMEHGFDFHGYHSPVPDDEDFLFAEIEGIDILHDSGDCGSSSFSSDQGKNRNQQTSFVNYYWFEFLMFDVDCQNFKLCCWIFLESNDRGIPSSHDKVFYKYFEKVS